MIAGCLDFVGGVGLGIDPSRSTFEFFAWVVTTPIGFQIVGFFFVLSGLMMLVVGFQLGKAERQLA